MKKLLSFTPILLIIFACQSIDSSINNNTFTFSSDTLSFDTVFTEHGSITQLFTIHNPNNNTIEITPSKQEKLESFRINIDGLEISNVNQIEIPGHDSIFCFVEITPYKNNFDSLLFYEKDLTFSCGDFQNSIKLIAWNRDVQIIKGTLPQNFTFESNKHYQLFDSVAANANSELKIESGATLYFHKGAHLNIFGSIHAKGTLENPITFRGDRLDTYIGDVNYDKLSGQWQGVRIYSSSSNNILENVSIRNAFVGLRIDGKNVETGPDLTLHNCRIENHDSIGIEAYNATIMASNCLFANCGIHCLQLNAGGRYHFTHVTVANYYTKIIRKSWSVDINNYYEFEDKSLVYDLYECTFNNSIIYGNHSVEFASVMAESDLQFNVQFNNCLIRVDDVDKDFQDDHFVNVDFWNAPSFKNTMTYFWDFNLAPNSPAINKGNPEYAIDIPFDLNGNSRMNNTNPDLGAYQYRTEE